MFNCKHNSAVKYNMESYSLRKKISLKNKTRRYCLRYTDGLEQNFVFHTKNLNKFRVIQTLREFLYKYHEDHQNDGNDKTDEDEYLPPLLAGLKLVLLCLEKHPMMYSMECRRNNRNF